MIGIYLFNILVLLRSDKNYHYQPLKCLYKTQQVTDHHPNSLHDISYLVYSPCYEFTGNIQMDLAGLI